MLKAENNKDFHWTTGPIVLVPSGRLLRGNWEVVWGTADSGIWWEVHRLAPAGTAEFWRHSADTGVLGALNHIYKVFVLYFKKLVIKICYCQPKKKKMKKEKNNKKLNLKNTHAHTHNSTHKNVQICNIFFHSWFKKKNTTTLPQTPHLIQ